MTKRTHLSIVSGTKGVINMKTTVKSLIQLADSLDEKGEVKLAGMVDDLIKHYAEEELPDELPEVEEESQDEGSELEEVSEEEPVEDEEPSDELPIEESPEAPTSPVGSEEDLPGMLGDSWYGEGPEWDLTPVSEGEFADTMLDSRIDLPTDSGEGVQEPGLEEDDSLEESSPEVGESVEVTEEEETTESPEEDAVIEAAQRLSLLANDLDRRGFVKEANLVDEILVDLKNMR